MGITAVLPYVIISCLTTYYVAPFQVNEQYSIIGFALKVLPLSYLVAYVNSCLGTYSEEYEVGKKRQKLVHGVFWALIWSLIGDGVMFFVNDITFFFLGMVAFIMAHRNYMRSFGFEVVTNKFNVALLYLSVIAYSLYLTSNEDLLHKISFSAYGCLLITVLWRALDRRYINDGRTPLQKMALPAGALLFFISDFSLVTFKLALPTWHAEGEFIVLATYFAAQGFIAFSTT